MHVLIIISLAVFLQDLDRALEELVYDALPVVSQGMYITINGIFCQQVEVQSTCIKRSPY